MKKRIGNDFLFYWIIKENGVIVNPESVHDFKIEIKHEFSGSKTSPQFDIVNGSARVRCEAFEKLGLYQLIATWRVVDTTFADGFRDCAADIESFEIVGRSAQADNENPEITTEMAIGFEGSDAYDVWVQNGNEGKTYEDYIAFLQKPANDAAVLADAATENANAAAILANTKAGLSDAAAVLATDKATLADSKATLANEKAALAQSAADNANTKATEFTAAEGLRVTAETGRVTAETGRATAEIGRTTAESARVSAETTRGANETGRQTAETARIGAESSRATAETGRTTAESGRVTAENARNAASNVYNLTVSVPLSAGQYYTLSTAVAAVAVGLRKKGLTITFESASGVWETYQFVGASTATWSTLAQWVKEPNQLNVTELLELPIAEVLNVLYAKIQALEAFIKTSQYGNVTSDQVDVVRNFNIWGKTNLIIEGTAAPTVVPDFAGQTFINTAGGVTYTAKGNTSVADWKQTSN